MSGMLRLLDRGYTMMWREGRVEEALIGLGDDFEWIVPDHPEGVVRRGAEGVYYDVDEARRNARVE